MIIVYRIPCVGYRVCTESDQRLDHELASGTRWSSRKRRPAGHGGAQISISIDRLIVAKKGVQEAQLYSM